MNENQKKFQVGDEVTFEMGAEVLDVNTSDFGVSVRVRLTTGEEFWTGEEYLHE